MPTLDRAELEDLRLYLDLGLAAGHAPRPDGPRHAQERHAHATAARWPHKNTKLITASFAAGLMEAALEQQVNLVNAEVLARERGIAIDRGAADRGPGDFGTMIQTEVTTERKTYVAAGTLFGKQFLRLVRLGSYQLDAHIDGTLLIFTHRDVPGLIGFIGTTFGDHGVNIAQMNVGREQPGGEAIGVVNLDSVPPAEALDAVQTAPRHPEHQPDQASAAGRAAGVAVAVRGTTVVQRRMSAAARVGLWDNLARTREEPGP